MSNSEVFESVSLLSIIVVAISWCEKFQTGLRIVTPVHTRNFLALAAAVVLAVGAGACSNNSGSSCASDDDCPEALTCLKGGGLVFGSGTCVRPCSDQEERAACQNAGGECRNGYCVTTIEVETDAEPSGDAGRDVSLPDSFDGDGCSKPTDREFCLAQGLPCGDVSGTDRCGNQRNVDCRALIDFSSSEKHCGGCGKSCEFDHSEGECNNGGCKVSSCEPGWANLDQMGSNGCECQIESETCNGEDDDCDGEIDETCSCDPGKSQSCYGGPAGTEGVGICTSGTQTCDGNGQWGSCMGSVTPAMEACGDGKDNDCDGNAEEDCTCNYDGHSTGVCRNQQLSSDGSCPKPADYQSMETACDGSDNDCDGHTDEGCPCDYSGSSTGVCGSAMRGPNGVCQKPAGYEPSENSCSDQTDNDCDGDTDKSDIDCLGDPGESCGSDGDCVSGICEVNSTSSTGVCGHRIFVSSSNFRGNLSGVSGADSKCQSAASSASLRGTWKAVISGPINSAKGRINVAGPVYNMKQQRVSGGANGFWSGSIDNAVQYDENTAAVSASVWTGTNPTGSRSSKHCSFWATNSRVMNGLVGDSSEDNSDWIEDTPQICHSHAHLYCIDGQ